MFKKLIGIISVILGINSLYNKEENNNDITYSYFGKKSLPLGIRNNNAGNLIRTPINWKGKIKGNTGRFEKFTSPEYGLRALMKDIYNDYKNKNKKTIIELISEFAPPNENDTKAYIYFVSNFMNVSANEKIDLDKPENMIKLTQAIVTLENGRGVEYEAWYAPETYKKAYLMFKEVA